MDGLSSALGTSKVKRQQQEIKNLKRENENQKQELVSLNQTINRERKENENVTGNLKAELNKIYEWLPDTKPLIRMGKYCKSVRFPDDMVKNLINIKPVYFSGKLYSDEFSQRFETSRSEAHLERDTKYLGVFNLLIDKINIILWFRQKHKEFLEAIGIKVKPKPEFGKNKGLKV